MSATFMELLLGTYEGDEIVISLKSTVPIFIAYPELIIPYGYNISDVMKYYNPDKDYFDVEEDLLLEGNSTPCLLLNMFAKVFESIISDSISKNSQLIRIPKVTLQVDIGGSKSHFESIAPCVSGVRNFESRQASLSTFQGKAQARTLPDLTEEQKHNILFLDDLLMKCRNASAEVRR